MGAGRVGSWASRLGLLVEILCRHLHKNNLHFETSLGPRRDEANRTFLGACTVHIAQRPYRRCIVHPAAMFLHSLQSPPSLPPSTHLKTQLNNSKLNQKQNQHFEPQVNESGASFSFSPSFATPPRSHTVLLNPAALALLSRSGVRFCRPQITRNHFAFNIRRQKQFKCLKTHLNTTGKTHSDASVCRALTLSLSLSLSQPLSVFLLTVFRLALPLLTRFAFSSSSSISSLCPQPQLELWQL